MELRLTFRIFDASHRMYSEQDVRRAARNMLIDGCQMKAGDEVLISAEDAWYTVELADRFSIEPSYRFWESERAALPNSKPAPEDFSYTSNNNTEWMKGEELLPLLGTEPA